MTDLAPKDYDVPLTFPARRSDPDTSHTAASSIEGSSSNDRALVLEVLRSHGGRGTADQVTAWLRELDVYRDRNCVSSRISQLVRSGLVSDTGERVPGRRNRPVMVVEVSDEGREAVR